MSNRTLDLSDALYDYMLSNSLREPDVLRRLRDETMALPEAGMQIAPEQGQFMALLVKLLGVRRIVEVGTFTGYSSLAMALALPDDGRIVALDVSPQWTAIARRYWQEAGVQHKIDLKLAPALQTLAELSPGFDLAFVDADKENYWNYHQALLPLVRSGGVLIYDNVLWNGAVIDPAVHDSSTVAIRQFNRALVADDRVDLSMLPLADGVTLARKR